MVKSQLGKKGLFQLTVVVRYEGKSDQELMVETWRQELKKFCGEDLCAFILFTLVVLYCRITVPWQHLVFNGCTEKPRLEKPNQTKSPTQSFIVSLFLLDLVYVCSFCLSIFVVILN